MYLAIIVIVYFFVLDFKFTIVLNKVFRNNYFVLRRIQLNN